MTTKDLGVEPVADQDSNIHNQKVTIGYKNYTFETQRSLTNQDKTDFQITCGATYDWMWIVNKDTSDPAVKYTDTAGFRIKFD